MVIFNYRLYSLLFFFCYSYSFAQVPNYPPLPKDTLETIVSDSAIIYVIEEEPITIVEKIKVVKPAAKYFLSVNCSVLGFAEYKKASSGYQPYVKNVNAATRNLPSYSMSISIWKCPRKIYTEYSISVFRMLQRFSHTYTTEEVDSGHYYPLNIGPEISGTNNFNYVNIGFSIGYSFRKEQKISHILCGGIQIATLLSYSSYTIDKTDFVRVAAIREEIKYREYIMNVSLQLRNFYKKKNTMFELTPYLNISPISSTKSGEVYKLYRFIAGLSLGITNKLF